MKQLEEQNSRLKEALVRSVHILKPDAAAAQPGGLTRAPPAGCAISLRQRSRST